MPYRKQGPATKNEGLPPGWHTVQVVQANEEQEEKHVVFLRFACIDRNSHEGKTATMRVELDGGNFRAVTIGRSMVDQFLAATESDGWERIGELIGNRLRIRVDLVHGSRVYHNAVEFGPLVNHETEPPASSHNDGDLF